MLANLKPRRPSGRPDLPDDREDRPGRGRDGLRGGEADGLPSSRREPRRGGGYHYYPYQDRVATWLDSADLRSSTRVSVAHQLRVSPRARQDRNQPIRDEHPRASRRVAWVRATTPPRAPAWARCPSRGSREWQTFRVWAPHATAVSVGRDLQRLGFGPAIRWPATTPAGRDLSADFPAAHPSTSTASPADPGRRAQPDRSRARRLTNSVGNGIIYARGASTGVRRSPPAAVERPRRVRAPVGTFGRVSTASTHARRGPPPPCVPQGARRRRDPADAAVRVRGAIGRGATTPLPVRGREHVRPAGHLKALVRDAPAAGIASSSTSSTTISARPISTSGLSDGWAENGKGGIYFYEDGARRRRGATPARTTADGSPGLPARQRDPVAREVPDRRLRWDATAWISSIYGAGTWARRIADGWRFMADVNAEVAARYTGSLTIAEDLRSDLAITRPSADGGAGFGTQWDGAVRPYSCGTDLIATDDRRSRHRVGRRRHRSGQRGRRAFRPGDLHRVARQDANGALGSRGDLARVRQLVGIERRRATLGSAIVLTSPGIPDAVPGQRLVEGSWFNDEDGARLDAPPSPRRALRLHRDLIVAPPEHE